MRFEGLSWKVIIQLCIVGFFTALTIILSLQNADQSRRLAESQDKTERLVRAYFEMRFERDTIVQATRYVQGVIDGKAKDQESVAEQLIHVIQSLAKHTDQVPSALIDCELAIGE